MKKSIIAILMCFTLVFTLAACKSDEEKKNADGTDATTVEAGEETTVTEEFNEDCFVTEKEESSYSDNECTFIKATYDVISLTEEAKNTYPELAAALEKINEEVRTNATNLVKEYMDEADEDYEKNPERFLKDGSNYTYEYYYSPIYITGKYVSFYVEDYCYMGGAHPSSTYYAYTLNIETGEEAPITEFITDTNALIEVVADSLDRYYGGGLFHTGEELIKYLSCAFSGEKFNDYEVDIPWSVTEKGIALYFGDYEVAPYASGHYTCEVRSSEHPELFK